MLWAWKFPVVITSPNTPYRGFHKLRLASKAGLTRMFSPIATLASDIGLVRSLTMIQPDSSNPKYDIWYVGLWIQFSCEGNLKFEYLTKT